MEQASQLHYNLAAFKRLILAELIYNGAATPSSICGYDKKAIRQMCEYPHRCGRSLLRLSNYMYLQSGFFRRIVDYYVNMALYRWTVDTEIRNEAFEQVSAEKLKKSLFRFAGKCFAIPWYIIDGLHKNRVLIIRMIRLSEQNDVFPRGQVVFPPQHGHLQCAGSTNKSNAQPTLFTDPASKKFASEDEREKLKTRRGSIGQTDGEIQFSFPFFRISTLPVVHRSE